MLLLLLGCRLLSLVVAAVLFSSTLLVASTHQQGSAAPELHQEWIAPMSTDEALRQVAPATNAYKRIADARAARPISHDCTLVIKGKPGGGVVHALLKCDSIKDDGGAVLIAYNSTYMEPFVGNFTGVNFDPMECGNQVDEWRRGNKHCMLSFCGASDSIHMTEVLVDGVELADRLAVVCGSSSLYMYMDMVHLSNNTCVDPSGIRMQGRAESALLRMSGSGGFPEPDAAMVSVNKCIMDNNSNTIGIDVDGSMLAVESCEIYHNFRFSAFSISRSTAVALKNSHAYQNRNPPLSEDEGWLDPELGWDITQPTPFVELRGLANLSIGNCTFNENMEQPLLSAFAGPGPISLDVSNLTMFGNTAETGDRAAEEQQLGIRQALGLLVVRGSNFTSNMGPPLLNIQNAAQLVVFDTTFTSDTTDKSSKAILGGDNSSIVVMQSYFQGSRCEAWHDSRISFFNTSFAGAPGSAPALMLMDNVHVVVGFSTFQGYTTTSGGLGGILATSGGLGGSVAAGRNSTLLINQGSRFISNSASYGSGGALAVIEDAAVILDGVWFENNTADLDGGAVFVRGPGAVVNITGKTLFFNNRAGGNGADVKANGNGNLVIGDSNINMASPTVSWLRTDCIVGEYRPDGAWNSLCQTCPGNTYSLNDANSTTHSCEPCPPNAKCSGGFAIAPHEGFWRSSERSTQIHSCPRSASCLEGGSCQYGYQGNLCGKCSREDGFGSVGPFKCAFCLSTWKVILIYLAVAIVLVLFLMILVHITIGDSTVSGGRCSTARPSAFLKIAVRHLQYLVIIGSVRVGWPKSIAAVSSGLAMVFPSAQQAISLNCVFLSYGMVPQAIKPLLTGLLVPVLVLLVVLMGSFMIWKFAKADSVAVTAAGVGTGSGVATDTAAAAAADQNSAAAGGDSSESASQGLRSWLVIRASLRHVVIVSFLVVLFFFYPGLVSTALSLFACLKIDDVSPASKNPFPMYATANASHGYWVPDIDQECWEGWHLKWALALGLPCMLLFCFGVPLGTWLALRGVGRAASLSEGASNPLSFLYDNYRVARYYWEVVSTVQIALVAALSVFSITIGAYFTMLLLSLAVVVSWALQVLLKPFAFVELHVTGLLSLATLYITALLALTFLNRDTLPPGAYDEVAGVLMLLLNVVFYLWCIHQIIIHSKGTVTRMWGKVQRVTRGATANHEADRAAQSSVHTHSPGGVGANAGGDAAGSRIQLAVVAPAQV